MASSWSHWSKEKRMFSVCIVTEVGWACYESGIITEALLTKSWGVKMPSKRSRHDGQKHAVSIACVTYISSKMLCISGRRQRLSRNFWKASHVKSSGLSPSDWKRTERIVQRRWRKRPAGFPQTLILQTLLEQLPASSSIRRTSMDDTVRLPLNWSFWVSHHLSSRRRQSATLLTDNLTVLHVWSLKKWVLQLQAKF